jgi:hypothetical protein
MFSRVYNSELWVYNLELGFTILGLGFVILGLGFRVYGLWSGFCAPGLGERSKWGSFVI